MVEPRPGIKVICGRIGLASVDAFAEWLAQEAEYRGGGLDADTIREMRARFGEAEVGAAGIDYQGQYDSCMNDREREIWDQTRRSSCQRLLVKRFSSLLPNEGQMEPEKGMLSRRMIPGVLAALEMMCGKEFFDGRKNACEDLVRRKRRENPGLFHWESMYKDPQANQTVDDVLMATVPHFVDFEKRLVWLHEVIETNLGAPDDYRFEGPKVYDWHLNERHVRNLMRFLYWSLHEKLKNPEQATAMHERYGAERVEMLKSVFVKLYPEG